jgi:hypothetical protein
MSVVPPPAESRDATAVLVPSNVALTRKTAAQGGIGRSAPAMDEPTVQKEPQAAPVDQAP